MTYEQALKYFDVPEANTIPDLKADYERKNHRMPNGAIADSFEQWLIYLAQDCIHCEVFDL